jgi:integrase/recombinase XerC
MDGVKQNNIILAPALMLQWVQFIDRGEKTTRTYITNLKQFFLYIQNTHTEQPTRETIISYREYLIANYKANTVKQYLQTVRQFFVWTAATGIYPNIAANIHAPRIRTNTHRKEALLPADVLRIEQSIKAHGQLKLEKSEHAGKDPQGRCHRAAEQTKRELALYTLAVNCGLRCIELSRANIKDFETVGGVAYLYIWGKGHAEPDQRKALAPEVAEILQEYINERADKPTFNSPLFVSTGNRSGGKRIAPETISRILKQTLKDAGYNSERITAHSLRHTAGTNVQAITNNLLLTQRYMRHENPATTEIYLHTNTERAEAETASRLFALYHSGQGIPEQFSENVITQSVLAKLK